jgi:hypothetical protein
MCPKSFIKNIIILKYYIILYFTIIIFLTSKYTKDLIIEVSYVTFSFITY